jgi:hypothetical protein
MRFRPALLLAPWFLVLILFAGCNGQGEGQVCSTRNGNTDCADNLTCTIEPSALGARCCPADISQSTTAVCGVHQNGLDADTSAPPLDAADGGDDASEDTTLAADTADTATQPNESGVGADASAE